MSIQTIFPLIANDRDRIAGSLLNEAHYHAKAIRVLIEHPGRDKNRLFGPAFTLLRPTFERLLRGYWLIHDATDADLNAFLTDDKVPNAGAIITTIE